ncbi:thioredoxin domain protein [Microbacterium phage phiMiGM15]
MELRIYTKTLSSCPQCDLTCREAAKLGDAVDVQVFEGIDLPENAPLLEAFKSRPRPLLSAPIVTLHDDDGNEVDSWAGFIPAKLKALA